MQEYTTSNRNWDISGVMTHYLIYDEFDHVNNLYSNPHNNAGKYTFNMASPSIEVSKILIHPIKVCVLILWQVHHNSWSLFPPELSWYFGGELALYSGGPRSMCQRLFKRKFANAMVEWPSLVRDRCNEADRDNCPRCPKGMIVPTSSLPSSRILRHGTWSRWFLSHPRSRNMGLFMFLFLRIQDANHSRYL